MVYDKDDFRTSKLAACCHTPLRLLAIDEADEVDVAEEDVVEAS